MSSVLEVKCTITLTILFFFNERSSRCLRDHLFSTYGIFFWKSNISYPLIQTRTCVYYQWAINVAFSENVAHIVNEWLFRYNSIINHGSLLLSSNVISCFVLFMCFPSILCLLITSWRDLVVITSISWLWSFTVTAFTVFINWTFLFWWTFIVI